MRVKDGFSTTSRKHVGCRVEVGQQNISKYAVLTPTRLNLGPKFQLANGRQLCQYSISNDISEIVEHSDEVTLRR